MLPAASTSARRAALVAFAALVLLGCGARPLVAPGPSPGVPETGPGPVGWATVDSLGQNGTTGGAGGPTVSPTTIAELKSYARMPGPLTIEVSGTIGDGINTDLASNKTVIGVGERPTFRGNLNMRNVQNVIIRDLFITGASPDGISLRRTHHVWVDHVDISDSTDGNLDITDQSDFVTVSWSKFWYSDPGQPHRLSNLVGSDDAMTADAGKLHVTYHHNWWASLVGERMPRVRYGDVHLYNNLYTSTGDAYCIRAAFNSRLLVESNYFQNVNAPLQVDLTGNLLEINNIYDMVTGNISGTGSAFVPSYSYQPDDAAAVPASVSASAGPRPQAAP